METVRERTSIQDRDVVPEDAKRLFRTAHDVSPERHVGIQAGFQEHVDNGVNKTVNLPESATREDVKDVFLLARDLGVKGVTVFRIGSRQEQVLGTNPLNEECLTECEYVAPEG